MSGSRLRTLVSLLVVLAIGSAGILHAPQAAARAGIIPATQAMHAVCHGGATEKVPPAQAHLTLDCCLMLCSSLPAVVPSTTQSFAFVVVDYPGYRNHPLVADTVPPDPGPPRA